jgi:hypothetical protein
MNFRVTGLSREPFRHLIGLSDAELASHNARRCIAEEASGYPDRIEMREARLGESLLLVNYEHQPARSPYRSSHAIYILENAGETYDKIGEIPEVMRRRLLSLRGFDQQGMLREADVVEGTHAEQLIERLFSNPEIAYIHAHNARQGCYSGRIDRA